MTLQDINIELEELEELLKNVTTKIDNLKTAINTKNKQLTQPTIKAASPVLNTGTLY